MKWLPGLDSNQDKLDQNQLCYHYTTGQVAGNRPTTRRRTGRNYNRLRAHGKAGKPDTGHYSIDFWFSGAEQGRFRAAAKTKDRRS